MNILAMIANDKGVSPELRRVLETPGQRAGREAMKRYCDQCTAEGRLADPVMADIEYQRAKCEAEGRVYYAGD